MQLSKSKINSTAVWIMPLMVYVLVFFIAKTIAVYSNCDSWGALCWSRYDSGLYLEIAKYGHTLMPCDASQGFGTDTLKWCGNAGWAPLYPFLMRIVSAFSGLDFAISGILLSHIFFLGFLLLAARIIKIQSFNVSNALTLLMVAIFPGGIYYFAIFPLSLFVFLITAMFWSLQNKKYMVAVLPSFLLALTYSSSILSYFCLTLYWLHVFYMNMDKRKIASVLPELKKQFVSQTPFRSILLCILIPGLLGMLTLFTYDWLVTGHWNAMYLVQEKYGHSICSPIKFLGKHIENFVEHQNTPKAWVDFNAIFFFFAIFVMVWILSKSKSDLNFLLVVFTLVMWYLPFSMGTQVSLYRSISLLAPAAIFMHHIRNYQKLIIILIFGVFYLFMSKMFIWSVLV